MGGFFWIATVFFSSCPYEHSECTQPTAWASGVKFAQVLKTILFPGQSLCRHTLQTWMACFIKISFLCSKVAASDFSCFCISLLITPAVSVVNIITFLVPWSYKKQTLMFFSVWFHLAMLKSQLPQYSILHNTHKKKKKDLNSKGNFSLHPTLMFSVHSVLIGFIFEDGTQCLVLQGAECCGPNLTSYFSRAHMYCKCFEARALSTFQDLVGSLWQTQR